MIAVEKIDGRIAVKFHTIQIILRRLNPLTDTGGIFKRNTGISRTMMEL